jgi:hypothetical protein
MTTEIMWPMYATERLPNEHFEHLTNSWCSYKLAKTGECDGDAPTKMS